MLSQLEPSSKLYTTRNERWEGVTYPLAAFSKVSPGGLEQLTHQFPRSRMIMRAHLELGLELIRLEKVDHSRYPTLLFGQLAMVDGWPLPCRPRRIFLISYEHCA